MAAGGAISADCIRHSSSGSWGGFGDDPTLETNKSVRLALKVLLPAPLLTQFGVVRRHQAIPAAPVRKIGLGLHLAQDNVCPRLQRNLS